jgi:APA family basic amino acid/polyamine antiporter
MRIARPETEKPASGHLLRVPGVVFGLAVMVGMTIGMGIPRRAGEIAALVPSAPACLMIRVLGASYALLGALTVLELDRPEILSQGRELQALLTGCFSLD